MLHSLLHNLEDIAEVLAEIKLLDSICRQSHTQSILGRGGLNFPCLLTISSSFLFLKTAFAVSGSTRKGKGISFTHDPVEVLTDMVREFSAQWRLRSFLSADGSSTTTLAFPASVETLTCGSSKSLSG